MVEEGGIGAYNLSKVNRLKCKTPGKLEELVYDANEHVR